MYRVDETGRLPFEQAVRFALTEGQPLFCVVPVFPDVIDDEEARAEGAKVWIIQPTSGGGWGLLYIAGPFFTAAHAANERISPEEIPDGVRSLSFAPTWVEEEWLSAPIQILVQKLVAASELDAGLPDYAGQRRRRAASEVRFPAAMIGRRRSGGD
ncbi:MAG: hypothetical protein WHS85_05835 [Hydrogenophilus sp.]